MSYKYIQASLPITGKTQQDDYVGLFQETLTQQFYNASNIWKVQEEYPFASKEYKDIDVRITHVINAETGLKLGDDWKTLLFKEVDHDIKVGRLYSFNNNQWLTINTEIIKNLAASATLKRCNNVLKWIDELTGAYYEEPCSIEYLIKEPRDYSTMGSSMLIPGGFVNIRAQFNEQTNKIRPNQRFLFGNENNWLCFRTLGSGRNALINLETTNNMSSGIIVLDMVANYVNKDTDDLVNGIADYYENVYSIAINQDNITASIGDTAQLSTTITYNGLTVSRDVEWVSSNTDIATVSTNGLVTMISNGVCAVTVNIKDNSTSDTCSVSVSSTPSINANVVISPNINYIFEKTTKTYSVYLYEDGVQQADAFTITCNPNAVPTANFTFTQIDGNSFSIVNTIKSVSSHLTVTCVSGTNTKTINIDLRGAW